MVMAAETPRKTTPTMAAKGRAGQSDSFVTQVLIVESNCYGFTEATKLITSTIKATVPGKDRITTSITVAITSPSQIPTYIFIPGIFFHLN